MGHIRLGRIPKRKPWSAIFGALESDASNAGELARTTAAASRKRFLTLERDPSLNYCFWILVRIATAARSESFIADLSEIGIDIQNVSSGAGFIHQVSRSVSRDIRRRGPGSTFTEIAQQALHSVLSANIVEQSRTLFGNGLPEIQGACRAISTKRGFGNVSRQYFAQIMSHTIRYIIDKEISNYVGAHRSLTRPQSVIELHRDVDNYCYDASKIVEEFAASWFSKNNWETNNNITEEVASGYTSYALKKIQMELEGGSV
jgi:hypothetical protein